MTPTIEKKLTPKEEKDKLKYHETAITSLLEDAVDDCEVELGNDNRKVTTKFCDSYGHDFIRRGIEICEEYADDYFLDHCKKRGGLREMCEYCPERFNCWTER